MSAVPIVTFDFPRLTRRAAPRKLLRHSDGDTPVIEQPIRMVSCDTPEKADYAGRAEIAQPKLDLCRDRLRDGYYAALPPGLRRHLLYRLDADAAASRHIAAGERASAVFEALLADRLTRPDGTRRPLAIMPTGEMIDSYGRLLAYFAPYFGGRELPPRGDPRRRTFNLDMIANGWAAFFPIWPSLPSNADLAQTAAEADAAWARKRGAWKEFGRSLLLAYEYRMCIKLAEARSPAAGIRGAFQRHCVDLRNRRELGLFNYWDVPPAFRLWYWQDGAAAARAALGLPPAD